MSARVSVIIPALNEERNLRMCLEGLAAQASPADEILVADNGSVDATQDVARSFAGQLPVRLLTLPRVTIAAVRNHAARESTGDILAFLDADCIPREDWLSSIHKRALQGAIVGAPYLPPLNANWIARAWAAHQGRANQGEVAYLPGGTIIAHRKDFLAWGGFDEALATNEDVDLCRRARLHGGRVVAWPELAVIHLGTPSTFGVFYRKNRWHGRHVVRVFLATLPRPANLFPVVFAVWSAFFAVAACAAMVWAAAGGPLWPSVIALGALAVPPLALAFQSASGRGAWRDLPALWVLFLIYGMARAAALWPGMNRSPKAR